MAVFQHDLHISLGFGLEGKPTQHLQSVFDAPPTPLRWDCAVLPRVLCDNQRQSEEDSIQKHIDHTGCCLKSTNHNKPRRKPINKNITFPNQNRQCKTELSKSQEANSNWGVPCCWRSNMLIIISCLTISVHSYPFKTSANDLESSDSSQR